MVDLVGAGEDLMKITGRVMRTGTRCAAIILARKKSLVHHTARSSVTSDARESGDAALRRGQSITNSRWWLTIVTASLVTSALSAASTLIVLSVILRIFANTLSGTTKLALLMAGTLVGASIGNWSTQPIVSRMLDPARERMARPRRELTKTR